MKEIFKQIHRYKEQDFEEGKSFEFTLEGKTKEININTEDYICQPTKKMEVGKSYKITVKKYLPLSTSSFSPFSFSTFLVERFHTVILCSDFSPFLT